MREVFFLSDFGLEDPYVAIVKAVMRQIAPGLTVHDLGHNLPLADLRRANYLLYESIPYLPKGAIVLGVVDPGVGSTRKAILVQGDHLTYIAPDNGLLTLAYLQDSPKKVFMLENPAFHLPRKSTTFHGRDIFAPVTAHVARGLEAQQLGPELPTAALTRLALHLGFGNKGEILTFDRFGNAITTLLLTPRLQGQQVRIGQHRVPLGSHYAEVAPGAPLAYIGSAGLLEIAIYQGNAKLALELQEGDPVQLEAIG